MFRITGPRTNDGWLEEYRAERGDFAQPVCVRVWLGAGVPPPSFAHSLDHPGAERILYKGVTEDGHPFTQSEPVDGMPLHRYCDARNLSLHERQQLLLQVLAVVEYAHRHLFSHGAVCLENVVVTSAGEVKVLRFGTGRRPVEHDSTGAEAAEDVTQLGRMTALLLAGAPMAGEGAPLAGEGASMVVEGAPLHVEQWFRQLAPDAREEIAACRSTTARQLLRFLQGDLDAVLATAMREGRAYGSVDLFRADLRHAFHGEPTSAYHATVAEAVRRWCRFHPATAVALLLLVVAAGTASAVFSVQTARLNGQRMLESARMDALVQMTGSLDARLDVAARDLPDPAPVRVALLQRTRQTLDAATEGTQLPPALAHALALQYRNLAERSAALGDRDAALQEGAHADTLERGTRF